MSTPTETLKHERARNRLILVVLGLVSLILLVRFFVLPAIYPDIKGGWGDLAGRFMEAGCVALLTGLFIPILAIWLGPDVKEKALISVLDRKIETSPEFEKAFENAQKWHFRGGLGTYFRGTTLPSILKQQPPIEIAVVLLDFRNATLMDEYAGYRTALSGNAITGNEVKKSIIDTIGTIADTVRKKPGVFSGARVALVGNYSSFRVDLSDMAVFLTQDNPDAPALRFDSKSAYYRGFQNEFTRQLKDAVNVLEDKYKDTLSDPRKFIQAAFSHDIGG